MTLNADDGKLNEITRIIVMPARPNYEGPEFCAICDGEVLVENSPLAMFDACRVLADRGRSGKVEFLMVDSYFISVRFDINQCARLVA